MKIYLPHSWVLTDELPMSAKGTPVLLDIDTQEVYYPEDMIGAISAMQMVSLAVEERGRNAFLPQEIRFISRFTKGDHESQSVPAGQWAR